MSAVPQYLYRKLETGLEVLWAQLITKTKSPLKCFKAYPLYWCFELLLHHESQLAKIMPLERVLFVGSGALPISAILLAHSKNVQIICIEKSAYHAALSRRVLEALDRSEQIQVLEQQAENVANLTFDVAIVAALSQPKKEILAKLAELSSKHSRILARTTYGIRKVFYNSELPNSLADFVVSNQHRATGGQILSSILFKRI